MKTKNFIVGIVFLVLVASTANGQAIRKYDRFTGKTSISSNDIDEIIKRQMQDEERPYILIVIEFEGENCPNEPAIQGVFFSASEDWKYLNYHELLFLADGKPAKILAETEHEGDVGSGYVTENVYFNMTWKEFLKLAGAKKVEFRLGIHEFELLPEEMADLRSFRDEVLK